MLLLCQFEHKHRRDVKCKKINGIAVVMRRENFIYNLYLKLDVIRLLSTFSGGKHEFILIIAFIIAWFQLFFCFSDIYKGVNLCN